MAVSVQLLVQVRDDLFGDGGKESGELDLEAKSMFSGTDIHRQSTDIISFVSTCKVGLTEEETNAFILNTSEGFSFSFCFS